MNDFDPLNKREGIPKENFDKESMSIEDAHKSNKDYMREASKKLLEVR